PPSPAPDPCAEGLARYRTGDAEGAAASFEAAAAAFPEDPRPPYLHGLLRFRQKRYGEAAARFRASADRAPGEDCLIKLAMAQGELRDLPGCLATLQEAARLLPASASVRAHLGTTLRTLGRLEEALEAYETALALDRGHVPALWGLGLALGMAGRLETGMETLRRAIALDPAFPPPHFHLGVLAWAAGDRAEARTREARLRGLAPSYADRLLQIMNEEDAHDRA
ncbi:MAG TPA: tetratricopeptide repeat protein, partial [Holophaga sp.]|nr:tetratricopeptide repeat protein [Holophaga sp.]